MDREYNFIDALYKVGFPVPKPLLYCSDSSVVGTEFYIMEHVKVTPTYFIEYPQDDPSLPWIFYLKKIFNLGITLVE